MVDNRRYSRACVNNGSLSQNGVNNGCGGGCDGNGSSNSKDRSLMRKLQMIDFAIVDTVLYLDAYPDSKPALEHYNKLISERLRICEALGRSGERVTHRDNVSTEHWTWTNGPWPWQLDAN